MPKISELTAGATVDGTEKIPAVQNGVTVYLTQAQIAALASVQDANFTLTDDVDTTKRARLQLSGITTATTRTFTFPDVTTTFAGTDATQALTNKTYNKVTVTAPATSATLTLIDGTTVTGPAASGTVMTLGNAETVTGIKTFGSAGDVGKLKIAGTTSGTTILDATAIASGTLTLPAATDTLVGKATTDNLTNKTYEKVTITAPASSATLTLIDGTTLTGPAASGTAMTLGNAETVTGAKTFGSAGAVGKLKVAGTTSGSTILDATAVASGTLTLPAATDTLVGKATTDVLTNKTLNSTGTGNVLQVSGVTVSAGQFPGETTTGSATAGNVGEIISSTVTSGSAVSLTSTTPANVTSISLTAGDWDVNAMIGFTGNAATTVTVQIGSLSSTSATLDTTDGRVFAQAYNGITVYNNVITRSAVGPARFSLSGTTTVFLVAQSTFAVNTSGAFGILRARRAR